MYGVLTSHLQASRVAEIKMLLNIAPVHVLFDTMPGTLLLPRDTRSWREEARKVTKTFVPASTKGTFFYRLYDPLSMSL